MSKELEKEILSIKKSMEKLTEKEIMRLAKEYKKTLAEIRVIILSVYTSYSDDEGNLNMTNVQVINEINKIDKVLVKETRKIGLLEVALTTALLKEVFSESYYSTAYSIDKGIDVCINYNILRPEFIESAINIPIEGVMYSDRIWNNKALMMQRLRRDLKKAMEDGTSLERLSRQLSKDIGSSLYESSRLLRTETAKVQTMAQDQIYKDSGLVGKVMYNATLDQKTSEICRELDSQIFDINSNYPKPPQHPNCRSVIIPIVDGWKPRNRRDNITGEIIQYKTYSEWKEQNNIN